MRGRVRLKTYSARHVACAQREGKTEDLQQQKIKRYKNKTKQNICSVKTVG